MKAGRIIIKTALVWLLCAGTVGAWMDEGRELSGRYARFYLAPGAAYVAGGMLEVRLYRESGGIYADVTRVHDAQVYDTRVYTEGGGFLCPEMLAPGSRQGFYAAIHNGDSEAVSLRIVLTGIAWEDEATLCHLTIGIDRTEGFAAPVPVMEAVLADRMESGSVVLLDYGIIPPAQQAGVYFHIGLDAAADAGGQRIAFETVRFIYAPAGA